MQIYSNSFPIREIQVKIRMGLIFSIKLVEHDLIHTVIQSKVFRKELTLIKD